GAWIPERKQTVRRPGVQTLHHHHIARLRLGALESRQERHRGFERHPIRRPPLLVAPDSRDHLAPVRACRRDVEDARSTRRYERFGDGALSAACTTEYDYELAHGMINTFRF